MNVWKMKQSNKVVKIYKHNLMMIKEKQSGGGREKLTKISEGVMHLINGGNYYQELFFYPTLVLISGSTKTIQPFLA